MINRIDTAPRRGAAALLLILFLAGAAALALSQAPGDGAPEYRVDPFWPRALPTVTDADGLDHQWVTGMVGASCIDSEDRIVTVNRGFLPGGLLPQEGSQSIPAPPVVVYDRDGNVADSWGDPALTDDGAAAVLPHGIHGCFVDYMDNIWIAGNSDGVVQKWSRDGSEMLLQIGTKGLCDGPPTTNPNAPYPTCGEPGYNSSETLLNAPADVAVDPQPDPVTGEPGSVYIADGYGNHRIVVFDAEGRYLRQWGSAGDGDGQFVERGGGHPHCVVIGNDGLVYACDRGQNRLQVFDREGNLVRIVPIDPPAYRNATLRATDIELSRDPEQRYLYVVDLGSNRVWILERESGDIVGSFGGSGHLAGEFTFPHTVVADSHGDLYVAETIGGRRHQKFALVRD
ncbi:MAG: hypothetical protein OXG72_11145 [Acidobacteria bacterium]|nr:hypothetical protein [Acidobacteriota bacterium]